MPALSKCGENHDGKYEADAPAIVREILVDCLCPWPMADQILPKLSPRIGLVLKAGEASKFLEIARFDANPKTSSILYHTKGFFYKKMSLRNAC